MKKIFIATFYNKGYFSGWNKDEVLKQVQVLIMEKLPEDNYIILKYIISFLSRVSIEHSQNRLIKFISLMHFQIS